MCSCPWSASLLASWLPSASRPSGLRPSSSSSSLSSTSLSTTGGPCTLHTRNATSSSAYRIPRTVEFRLLIFIVYLRSTCRYDFFQTLCKLGLHDVTNRCSNALTCSNRRWPSAAGQHGRWCVSSLSAVSQPNVIGRVQVLCPSTRRRRSTKRTKKESRGREDSRKHANSSTYSAPPAQLGVFGMACCKSPPVSVACTALALGCFIRPFCLCMDSLCGICSVVIYSAATGPTLSSKLATDFRHVTRPTLIFSVSLVQKVRSIH